MILLIITVITLAYVVLLLWLRLGLATLSADSSSPYAPKITVVVAARNEENNIPNLLAALRKQDYPQRDVEIIVVDDSSTDGTYALLRREAATMPNLHPVRLSEVPDGWSPKKWALTTAIERSKGEVIVATDADCEPAPGWIGSLVAVMSDPSVGFVFGPAPLVSHRKTRWGEALLLDSCALDALAAGGTGVGLALTCTGRNLAFRRTAFDDIGGYHGIQGFVSGDDDLLLHQFAATGRWGIRFALSSDTVVPSPPPATLGAFVRQRLRFASKGRAYFGMATGPYFTAVLTLIYLANLAAVVSSSVFIFSLQLTWILPVAAKLAAEALLVLPYLKKIGLRVRISTFVVTGLLHPFYVAILGALGNFVKVSWKDRQFGGGVVPQEASKRPG